MNELTTIPPPLELTATTPVEMQQAQTGLIQWCGQKIAHMKHEAEELSQAYEIAKQRKWSTATLKRHSELAAKRVTYYEKIKAALEAGYCIVPNFPVTVFAIRTNRDKPLRKLWIGTWKHGGSHNQESQQLPVGEGEYKSPNPLCVTHTDYDKDTAGKITKTTYTIEATDFCEVDFPINMAKPNIMEATGRAEAMKIFDELGVLPDPHPKKDPLIVGHIIDPTPRGYSPKKYITFIIAWHLNVRDL